MTIHLVVCTVFASCCPVSWSQRDTTSEDCHQPGVGRLVDQFCCAKMAMQHDSSMMLYVNFRAWVMQSYRAMAPTQFGDSLGSLNMGMALNCLRDHGFTRWMRFERMCYVRMPQKWGPEKKSQEFPKMLNVDSCHRNQN